MKIGLDVSASEKILGKAMFRLLRLKKRTVRPGGSVGKDYRLYCDPGKVVSLLLPSPRLSRETIINAHGLYKSSSLFRD